MKQLEITHRSSLMQTVHNTGQRDDRRQERHTSLADTGRRRAPPLHVLLTKLEIKLWNRSAGKPAYDVLPARQKYT